MRASRQADVCDGELLRLNQSGKAGVQQSELAGTALPTNVASANESVGHSVTTNKCILQAETVRPAIFPLPFLRF